MCIFNHAVTIPTLNAIKFLDNIQIRYMATINNNIISSAHLWNVANTPINFYIELSNARVSSQKFDLIPVQTDAEFAVNAQVFFHILVRFFISIFSKAF